MCAIVSVDIAEPVIREPKLFNKMGSRIIKPAPKKAPETEPNPPITTINNISKDLIISKACGSTVPKTIYAHNAPARPHKNEETPKAISLVFIRFIPMASAAISISLTAIHARPISDLAKLRTANAHKTTIVNTNKY